MMDFSADLAHVFNSELGLESSNTLDLQEQMEGRALDMSVELREKRKLAKRIIKAVQPAINDAARKESELSGRPYEKQMRDLDQMLEGSVFSRRDSVDRTGDAMQLTNGNANDDSHSNDVVVNGDISAMETPEEQQEQPSEGTTDGELGIKSVPVTSETALGNEEPPADQSAHDVSMHDAPLDDPEALERAESIAQLHGELSAQTAMILASHTPPASTDDVKKTVEEVQLRRKVHDVEPPTPPMSFEGNQQASLTSGGIMWYVEQFDPIGTTVHEERWTGPDVLRAMSEELSEIGDEELQEMGVESYDAADPSVDSAKEDKKIPSNTKKNGKPRRKWRGFR